MSFCVAVPEFNHNAVPVTQPTCPYCGMHLRHVPQSAGSSKVIGNITAYTASSTYVSPRQPSPVHYIVIDSENDFTEASSAAMRPAPTSTAQISALQKEKNRFSTFDRNRKAVDITRADGFVSQKDKLKAKGKFEVGAKKDIKVSDNRTADIFVGTKGQQAGKFALQGTSS
jgi:hypothetical protein